MKRKLILTLVLLGWFLALPQALQAQDSPPAAVKEFFKDLVWQQEKRLFWDWGQPVAETQVLGTSDEAIALQPRGWLPGQPFYFLKRWREKLGLAFTFDPVEREKKRIALAQERLAEAKKLLEQGRSEWAQRLMTEYAQEVERALANLERIPEEKKKELAQNLEQLAARHELVLEQVAEKVPEEAKPAIERAIESSQKGMDTAADVLGRPPVPPELKRRLEALKRQALITPEEAAAIINSRSRREAREKIKQLLAEAKMPAADFKLLDEAQKEIVPEQFEKIREQKKLEELKRLEELKKKGELSPEVVEQIDQFVRDYQPGEPVPPQLRRQLPFQRLEELEETVRPELLVGEKIGQLDVVGPGGCYDRQTCYDYCRRDEHRQECLDFLKTAPDQWRQKAQVLMRELGCQDRRSCRTRCQQQPEQCARLDLCSLPQFQDKCRRPMVNQTNQEGAEKQKQERQGIKNRFQRPDWPLPRKEELPRDDSSLERRDGKRRSGLKEIKERKKVESRDEERGPGKRPKINLSPTTMPLPDWLRGVSPSRPPIKAEPIKVEGERPEDHERSAGESSGEREKPKFGLPEVVLPRKEKNLFPERSGQSNQSNQPSQRRFNFNQSNWFNNQGGGGFGRGRGGRLMDRVRGWFDEGHQGPGGCQDLFSCLSYCQEPTNWTLCRQFAD